MSSIKSKETKPEILVRKFLFSMGLRYRKNITSLPGKPDIVLAKYKIVIFINGCFWHGHKNCKAARLPKTRIVFWKNKIKGNQERDRKTKRELKKKGWKVLEIWGCELKSDLKRKKRLDKLLNELVPPLK